MSWARHERPQALLLPNRVAGVLREELHPLHGGLVAGVAIVPVGALLVAGPDRGHFLRCVLETQAARRRLDHAVLAQLARDLGHPLEEHRVVSGSGLIERSLELGISGL